MKRSYLFKVLALLSLLLCFFGTVSGISHHAVFAQTAQHTPPGESQPAAANSDWTMFNLHHARFNINEKTLSPANVSSLARAWSVAPSTSAVGGSSTELAVANGIVYTTSPNATSHNSLDALQEKTGTILWQRQLPSRNGPGGGGYFIAVAGGLVYLDDGPYAEAYNATTGAIIWSRAIAPENAMVVDNGVLYVQSELGYPKGQSSLYALDAQTGTTLWNVVMQQSLSSASPAVANGIIYVGAMDGTFLALHTSNGSTLWTAFLGTNNAIITAPVVDKGVVYVEADSTGLFAFDAQTGHKRWFAPSDPYVGSPAVAYGLVFVIEGVGAIQAYKETTGKVVWQHTRQALLDTLYSATVANGVVYASANSGGPIAFDARTGKRLYTYDNHPTQGESDSSPVVANGMVFFNMLYTYNYTDALQLK
jgi:outer membrane protein assembly factor BamB